MGCWDMESVNGDNRVHQFARWFHTVVGSLSLEVYNVCVTEGQAETDGSKKDSDWAQRRR